MIINDLYRFLLRFLINLFFEAFFENFREVFTAKKKPELLKFGRKPFGFLFWYYKGSLTVWSLQIILLFIYLRYVTRYGYL